MDWSKLLAELCLVLPSDIYLDRIGVTEPKSGTPPTVGDLSIDGKALDYPYDVPDIGYKSIAKLLVRMAELSDLQEVWLYSSVKPAPPVVAADSGSSGGSGATDTSFDYYITFSIQSKIAATTTSTANASGVPAPPTP
jgi:hypothetical protein